jgi:phage shock protein A
MPFSSKISIDKDRVMGDLSEIRTYLPEEIHRSKRIIDDQNRVIEDANRDAQKILRDATIEAENLVANHTVFKQAEEAAARELDSAKRDSKRMRSGAINYIDEKIAGLEKLLEDVLVTVDAHYVKFKNEVDEVLQDVYNSRQQLRLSKQNQSND